MSLAGHLERRGALLVFASAEVWRFGGAVARFSGGTNSCLTVF